MRTVWRGRKTTGSPVETEALGRKIGETFAGRPARRRPSLVLLKGALGAGKTVWTRGFAEGFGVPAEVHSPTYTVMNVYRGGEKSLFHLDLYRLGCLEEIVDIGVFEVIEDGSPCIVEWAERVPQLADWPHLSVTFEVLDDEAREIVWEKFSGRA